MEEIINEIITKAIMKIADERDEFRKEIDELKIKLDDKNTEIQILKEDIKADENEYKKEIRKLKQNCKKCIIRYRLDEYVNEIYTKNEFVSKVKILDKIKKLNKGIEKTLEVGKEKNTTGMRMQIDILEELLEEK